ncbi:hypothetical protein BU16DRAFT_247502 [Lophium mytilinum]|uniref:Uncharacterized protein n=1 Tax=Lophium mytilinum TaxID=390894 RepID=A0A6A6R7V4_9PEZI|nr:hypothetical protein BU16DRAFT_247502 [Lophium mytilinum]
MDQMDCSELPQYWGGTNVLLVSIGAQNWQGNIFGGRVVRKTFRLKPRERLGAISKDLDVSHRTVSVALEEAYLISNTGLPTSKFKPIYGDKGLRRLRDDISLARKHLGLSELLATRGAVYAVSAIGPRSESRVATRRWCCGGGHVAVLAMSPSLVDELFHSIDGGVLRVRGGHHADEAVRGSGASGNPE